MCSLGDLSDDLHASALHASTKTQEENSIKHPWINTIKSNLPTLEKGAGRLLVFLIKMHRKELKFVDWRMQFSSNF